MQKRKKKGLLLINNDYEKGPQELYIHGEENHSDYERAV